MDIHEWLRYGIDKGFCTDSVCGTHDWVQMTEEEEKDFDEGGDPCIVIVRLYPEGQ